MRRFGHPFGIFAATALLLAAAAPDFAQPAPGGDTVWMNVAGGRLKTVAFASPAAGPRPILIIVLHGDAPFDKPRYQYTFAERAASSGDVVAAAILRPGYTDAVGDTSSGVRGLTTGDNWTADRIAAIAQAIEGLRRRFHARAVVLAGHSGGAAIAADLLALRPDLARAALLVSCPCDLAAWRAHMKTVQKTPIWNRPVESVSSIDLVRRVPPGDKVVMTVGGDDQIAPSALTDAYAAALTRGGADVRVVKLPGKDHEIFLEPAVQAELARLVRAIG